MSRETLAANRRIIRRIVVTSLSSAVLVWLVMLALGAAHSYDARVPALGFWALVWLMLAVRFAWQFVTQDGSES